MNAALESPGGDVAVLARVSTSDTDAARRSRRRRGTQRTVCAAEVVDQCCMALPDDSSRFDSAVPRRVDSPRRRRVRSSDWVDEWAARLPSPVSCRTGWNRRSTSATAVHGERCPLSVRRQHRCGDRLDPTELVDGSAPSSQGHISCSANWRSGSYAPSVPRRIGATALLVGTSEHLGRSVRGPTTS